MAALEARVPAAAAAPHEEAGGEGDEAQAQQHQATQHCEQNNFKFTANFSNSTVIIFIRKKNYWIRA